MLQYLKTVSNDPDKTTISHTSLPPEGHQLMSEGAKWKLYIPSDLAYGAQGAGEMIPPHSTLIFEVELIEVL